MLPARPGRRPLKPDETLFPHHRHRQLPAPAPVDQCRLGRAGRPRRGNLGRMDCRAHRHSGAALCWPRMWAAAIWDLKRPRSALELQPVVAAAEIDLIIVATSTPTWCSRRPPPWCNTSWVSRVPRFDVQAVCSGFVYALTVADAMIQTGCGQPGTGHWRRGVFPHSGFQ
jgi:hypothetical protein